MTTIIVDKDLCNNCGVCSTICSMGIIAPGDKSTLPTVADEASCMCIKCGHCEAFCPSQALILNLRPDEKKILPAKAGTILPEDMIYYLQKRRSVRSFAADSVPKETIMEILDAARYAASGGNGQPVQWIVVHDRERVRKIAGLTMDWMKSLKDTDHPMKNYLPFLISAWEGGHDVICRGAPHLLFAHIPEGNQVAPVDAIIALTHFDVAAPAFGVGTCWAGFVAAAAGYYEPLKKELGLKRGRKIAYAMMFGIPRYKAFGIPRRNPLQVTWL